MAEPILTVAAARAYPHDNESSDGEMAEYVALAESYIANGVGTVNPADPRAKHLAKQLV